MLAHTITNRQFYAHGTIKIISTKWQYSCRFIIFYIMNLQIQLILNHIYNAGKYRPYNHFNVHCIDYLLFQQMPDGNQAFLLYMNSPIQ